MNILSTPIMIRKHRISSRCFLAPINTGYTEKGNPTKRLINFHDTRSGKGIGISFIGTTAISRDTVPNRNTLVLDSQSDLNSFSELSSCIKKNGSLPGIQLSCRLTNMTPAISWLRRSVKEYIENIREEIYSYSEYTFIKLSNNFYQSIALAVETGYEVIQLHAAHGYFLSLLFSPIFNIRKDRFGFPTCSLIFDIIEKTRQSFPNIIISIRMNCVFGLEDKNEELKRTIRLATRLLDMGVDHIDFSAGVYDINKHLIYPSVSDGHACYLPYVLRIQKEMGNDSGIISFVGNVWNLEKIDNSLMDNMAVSIGRSLIADPRFVSKYFNNHPEKIVLCKREKTCPCHYFSNKRAYVECLVNEKLGQEI